MPGNFYPPEGHDFVGTDEIRKLTEGNRAMFVANFEGRAVELRSKVFSLLAACGGLNEGARWAIYHITEDSGDGGVIELNYHKEVLIFSVGSSWRTKGGRLILPSIRIITNEMVRCDDDVQWITQDAIIDGQNDTQYLMSAINAQNRDEYKRSLAPIFAVDGGDLLMSSNYIDGFTPYVEVTAEATKLPGVVPFGHFECMEDKLYALSKLEEIVASVAGLEPVYRSGQEQADPGVVN